MTPNSDKPINSEEIRCKHCNKPEGQHVNTAYKWCIPNSNDHRMFEPIKSVSPASAIEQLIYGYIEGSGKDNGFHLYAPLSEQVRMKVMLFLQGLYENKRLNDGLREIAKNLQIEMESINSVSPTSTKENQMFTPKEYFEAGFNQCRIKAAVLLEQRYHQDELGGKVRMLEPEFPDTECDSCEIGPSGHQYDCPNAQE